jgi:D-tyrosyl-tRNA(Tyr) deacylase
VKAVVQRVRSARVRVSDTVVGEIGKGVVVFFAIEKGDKPEDMVELVEKVSSLRIFPDSTGKMALSLKETGGEILLVSNFTVAGEIRKGRRPDFHKAMEVDQAKELYEEGMRLLSRFSVRIQKGVFGALMEIDMVQDGPVTLLLGWDERKRDL